MRRSLLVALTMLVVLTPPVIAEVIRIEIDSREDVLGGRPFGDAGPYEKISGRVYFAFDPSNPMNRGIVDLGLATLGADGRVEAWANFVVLRPKNPQPGGNVALLEVSNRGGKASLPYFNAGRRTLDPEDAEHYGDGLLMRLGLTVIWVGWQQDVPKREGLLRLHGPVLTGDGEPITGLVRADWVVDAPTRMLRVGHRDHIA